MIPDNVIHWLLAASVPSIGGLFIFLLKRTFKDFEDKVGSLFNKLENSMKEQQAHDTRIQLLEHRVEQLESPKKRR